MHEKEGTMEAVQRGIEALGHVRSKRGCSTPARNVRETTNNNDSTYNDYSVSAINALLPHRSFAMTEQFAQHGGLAACCLFLLAVGHFGK